MRLYVGSDHAGVELRDTLAALATDAGWEVAKRLGPARADERVDYPDVAHEVCAALERDPQALGLLVCGTGQGMAMTANRHPGIRAAVCADTFSARMARAHNDARVLCLGERVVGAGLAGEILRAFLSGSFEGGRHARRVAKIEPAGG